MNKRIIRVTVEFNMEDFNKLEITNKKKVKKMVEEDMIEYFGYDEGYNGLTVDVIDN